MNDDSGTFNVKKLRSGGGVWLPLSLLVIVIGGAVTWGTNANRISTLETQQVQSLAHTDRIEAHLAADDQQITALTTELRYIREQLSEINRKLDQAEQERRR